MAHPLGSHERPLVLRVTSEERLNEVVDICDHHGFIYVIGLEGLEDLTDLRKAIQQKMARMMFTVLAPAEVERSSSSAARRNRLKSASEVAEPQTLFIPG